MKTVTLNEREIKVIYSLAQFSGYGHYDITVDISLNGLVKNFTATTNNMQGLDEARELEGEEKYFALYELIQYDIEESIMEWMDENPFG